MDKLVITGQADVGTLSFLEDIFFLTHINQWNEAIEMPFQAL